jgi:prepilin-type N-terminal cleavage/methylation domain-containing protein
MKKNGFTLIEILVTFSVIAFLVAIIVIGVNSYRENAYYSRASLETTELAKSLSFYLQEQNNYPDDVNRDLPAGLETYLPAGDWPNGPWPGSVYDWENWDDPDHPGMKIYQISIRFCPIGGSLSECNFPKASWAENFDINSSLYYCISGACRAHISEPIDYPAKCINC